MSKRKQSTLDKSMNKKNKSSETEFIGINDGSVVEQLVVPFTVSTKCKYIFPQTLKGRFIVNTMKFELDEGFHVVIPNTPHSGFVSASQGTTKDGRDFQSPLHIDLYHPDSDIIKALDTLAEDAWASVCINWPENLNVQEVGNFRSVAYTKDDKTTMRLNILNGSLLIHHEPAELKDIDSKLPAEERYKVSQTEAYRRWKEADKDGIKAVCYEDQGRTIFYTKQGKDCIEDAITRASFDEYPSYFDGLIFNKYEISTKLQSNGWYVYTNKSTEKLVVGTNLFLTQIKVVEGVVESNPKANTAFSLRRMHRSAAAEALDFLM